MKKKIIIIILNLLYCSCFSQTARKIFVADSATHEPIEYACIVFADTAGGTYSNNKGLFYIPENIKYVEISNIGYHSKTVKLNKNTDTIFLSSQIYEISETKVTPVKQKRKPVELGYAKEKSKYSIGFFGGGEIAVYIPLDNENNIFGLIKQVIIRGETDIVKEIKIGKITYNTDKANYTSVFKVNFYQVNENKEIGELINTEDIVFTNKNLKGRTKLDVSKYGIYMPENGIFVAIEFVGSINAENGELITDIKKTGILHRVLVSYEIASSTVYEKQKFKRELHSKWKKSVRDTVVHKEFNNGYTPLISIALE
ncbi:MAG: carboxypeptidase-like regulatory domain-containing protein [Prevotellaceae bacterium]|jgi:hypothetical protein|nr:carboxypeptidase-like regulatory domain-containing protein [Prevotellaceae bacterium]